MHRANISIVVVTRNRGATLTKTLKRLDGLEERAPIIVVDNASTDGTAEAVAEEFPGVTYISVPENLGGAARNIGVESAATPYVAFSDDDSWWREGSLRAAADALDREPSVALVAARVLVGPDELIDPVCEQLSASPHAHAESGWPSVMSFVGCGSVVRRDAFLAAGGFHRRYGRGGEEALLCIDLSELGWETVYLQDIVAHPHPSPLRDERRRKQVEVRNALWCAWMRRPVTVAARHTSAALLAAALDSAARDGLLEAVKGLPWVRRQRRKVSPYTEKRLRELEELRRPPSVLSAMDAG